MLKAATGFGGGVGASGSLCGIVTGGVDFTDPEQLSEYYATGHKKCVEMAGKTAAKLAELLE